MTCSRITAMPGVQGGIDQLVTAVGSLSHLIDQSEASIQVTWSVPTNQRPVSLISPIWARVDILGFPWHYIDTALDRIMRACCEASPWQYRSLHMGGGGIMAQNYHELMRKYTSIEEGAGVEELERSSLALKRNWLVRPKQRFCESVTQCPIWFCDILGI